MRMAYPILESLRQTFLTRCSIDSLPESVWKRTSALNTWGTNAIEGNTLTWRDVEKLLLEQKSVSNRPVPDVIETIQHEAAFRGLIQRRAGPITMVTVLELHDAVFRGIKEDVGQWRRVNVRIVGSRHAPPRMERVVPLMDEWERTYSQRDIAGEDVFTLAAWMHQVFESIHPFSDGNGRAGRLILNLHFLKHNWPPVHVLPPDRDEYIRALEAGHQGDLSRLERFLLTLMGRSLLDMLDQVGTKEDELRPLGRMEKAGPYSAKYLALRASHGVLPAIKVGGDWHTSPRALSLYRDVVGRD